MTTQKSRKAAQLEFAQAIRTLAMIQGAPCLRGVCSPCEIEPIIVAAENAERGVRERYLTYQQSYNSKRPVSIKTVREQRDEEREALVNHTQ